MIILTWEECPRVLDATTQTTLWLLLPGLVWGLHLFPLASVDEQSLPPTHTHTDTNCPLLSWHPSLHPDHPMNKNENPKKWMDRKRGREGVGEEGRKTKCLGQDQPGISSYVVPTHWLKLLSFSARSILSPHVPEKTTQTLNDFMI